MSHAIRMTLRQRCAVLAAAAVGAAAAGDVVPAVAAGFGALPAEQCVELKKQRQKLEAAGVADRMAKGVAWARDNLSPAQVSDVARLITLDEQLKFKCPVGFDNAVVAAIRDQDGAAKSKAPPPLPVRPPAEVIAERKLAALRPTEPPATGTPSSESGVPLPSKNAGRTGGKTEPGTAAAARVGTNTTTPSAPRTPPLPKRAEPKP